MKPEKNKIVFASVILCIVLFIIGYIALIIGEKEAPALDSNQIPVPKLKDEQKAYGSKLDALNDLKEVKQTNAPSIYDERLLDSTGTYDPYLLDKEKIRLVDSIYHHGRINYTGNSNRKEPPEIPIKETETLNESVGIPINTPTSTKEIALEHQLFFASSPSENQIDKIQRTNKTISVTVDGTQTVQTNSRLHMRLLQDAVIDGIQIPRNTSIYGFVSFQPNRTLITIKNINHQPVKLKAFDLQDGREGLYIENNFRVDATQEVVDDVVQDINIAGLPQVSGIKKIFQRNHRKTKVTILNNYQLILKPTP